MTLDDLTVVIIARDEQENLRQLLPNLWWAGAVLVVDNHSSDQTAKVAREAGAEVIESASDDFAQIRNEAVAQVTTEWVFYLDADERVTKELRDEIVMALADDDKRVAAWSMRRANYHYGYLMAHGGWDEDWVVRIFRRECLRGWTGSIHESPEWRGEMKKLHYPLLHLTHRDTAANLAKSSRWTIKEAQLLVAGGLPPVTKITILRKVVMEFYRRYWRDKGRKDGMAGFVESLVQAFNRGLSISKRGNCSKSRVYRSVMSSWSDKRNKESG